MRHGQTELNKARRYQGATDSPLTAFGAELKPAPDATGVALAALDPAPAASGAQADAQLARVRRSVAYLEGRWPSLRTPLALGWALLGLSAVGRRPHDALSRVAATLDRRVMQFWRCHVEARATDGTLLLEGTVTLAPPAPTPG